MLTDLRFRGDRQQLFWFKVSTSRAGKLNIAIYVVSGRAKLLASLARLWPGRSLALPGKMNIARQQSQAFGASCDRAKHPSGCATLSFIRSFPTDSPEASPFPSQLTSTNGALTPTPHGYQGGDLTGAWSNTLDYLTDLGVNADLLHPHHSSQPRNHRYHTHDYHKVDPMLGGNEALRRLIDEAHRRKIRVVLDGVFNHASRGFFQFHDILENGENSAYLDWFTVHGFPLNAYDHSRAPGYGAWWNLHALPKFNVATPAVREFLFKVGRAWIDFSIDGWRLDVASEIADDSTGAVPRPGPHAGNPDAYIPR